MNDYFESVKYCSDDCDKALHLEIARVAGSLWQALPQPSPFTLLALSYFAHGLHMTLPKAFWFPNGELDFRQKIFCLIFITSRLYFSQLIVNFLMTQYFYISHVQYREWRQKDTLPERMLCILSIHSWHRPSSSQSNTNAFSLHLCFLDLFIE